MSTQDEKKVIKNTPLGDARIVQFAVFRIHGFFCHYQLWGPDVVTKQ